MKNLALCIILIFFCSAIAQGQGVPVEDLGTISGSLQTDVAQYNQDTLIGAPEVDENVLSNTFFNLLFTRGGFTAGVRFEAYVNPLLGIDPRFGTSGPGTGIGIPYRFAKYENTIFDVTAGNFYEQFGSGMVLRTYEERNLGFDNSMDGLRLKFRPSDGIQFTGFIARQRAFWDLSEGIIRGADMTLDVHNMFDSLLASDMFLTLGASAVSRFQEDQNSQLNLPENVLAWSTRALFGSGGFQGELEYAYKINDPGATNGGSYNPGNALYMNLSYSTKGFGINYAAKRIDNMDLRSDRTATGLAQQVNYLPALTKQHTWRLITLYPYATQPTGEFGMQAEATFTIPRGSFLGDDETTVTLNGSWIRALDTTRIQTPLANGSTTDRFYYDAEFIWSDRTFFRDFNFEVIRKFGRDFKVTLAYINLQYDQDVIERRAAINESKFGLITANFAVAELWFKMTQGQYLRTEIQWMGVSHPEGADLALQNGDWAMLLLEYTISPNWFFTVFDEYNYGNENPELRVHYPNATVAWVKDALRLQGGYGRIRGGILCVGGICRPVPASNGFNLSVQYSF
jgi:hypothetical protein